MMRQSSTKSAGRIAQGRNRSARGRHAGTSARRPRRPGLLRRGIAALVRAMLGVPAALGTALRGADAGPDHTANAARRGLRARARAAAAHTARLPARVLPGVRRVARGARPRMAAVNSSTLRERLTLAHLPTKVRAPVLLTAFVVFGLALGHGGSVLARAWTAGFGGPTAAAQNAVADRLSRPVPPASIATMAHTLDARTHGEDAVLAQKMRWLLDDYAIPEAGVVVLDVETGAVRAAVGRKNGKPDVSTVLTPTWPAASVFKIVSTASLLNAGLTEKSKLCFDGGFRKVTAKHLGQKTGGRCATLSEAFAKSLNVPMARWADKTLDAATLGAFASTLGFGDAEVVGLPPRTSGLPNIPSERLAFARTAAGFGDVPLSPLHGAMLAATFAGGGMAPVPRFDPEEPMRATRLMDANTAHAVRRMMVRTVKAGSARRSFRERGRPALGKLGAGGKTGSLFAKGKDLTWFVGFAPADKPEVAVAVYVVNGPKWRVRAPYVGREALRSALLGTSPYRPPHAEPAPQVSTAPAKPKPAAPGNVQASAAFVGPPAPQG